MLTPRKRRCLPLQVEHLEDRSLPAALPLPGWSSLLEIPLLREQLSAVPSCSRSAVAGPGPCAPELPEWLLGLLHTYAQAAVDLVVQAGWGQSVRDIYRAFLDGPADLREFGDGQEVVEGNGRAVGFRASPVTRGVTQSLHQALREALEQRLAAPPPDRIDCASLPANQEQAIPIRRSLSAGLLTPEQLRSFELALEYTTTAEIPGIMAGGLSDSMGAGEDDRVLEGSLIVTRRTVDGQTVALDLRSEITVGIIDSIDFCPGALGDWLAQLLTRPLQLLQANYWAQAVPFTVTFTADPFQTTLSGDDLPPSCQGRGSAPGGEGPAGQAVLMTLAEGHSVPPTLVVPLTVGEGLPAIEREPAAPPALSGDTSGTRRPANMAYERPSPGAGSWPADWFLPLLASHLIASEVASPVQL